MNSGSFGARARKACALLVVLLVACAEAPEGGPVGHSTEAVISGNPDSAGTYNAVARMSSNCSGVLIAPRVVLTSMHCFAKHATGCTTLADTPISVRFAEMNGGWTSGASYSSRRVQVEDFALRPGGAYDIGSCADEDLCEELTLRDAIDHSKEHMLLFLADDAPSDVKPLPVMIHPSTFAVVQGGGYAGKYGTFAGIETWAQTAKPIITFVGTGIGTQQYVSGQYRGRDVGRSRWQHITSTYGGALGMSSCTQEVPSSGGHPVVGIVPDDITNAMAPDGGWNAVMPGTDFANADHSHAGTGDSGGPAIVGKGPSFNGVLPTNLPAPAAGDSYDTNLGYVVGNANLWIAGVDDRPGTAYAPTYTQDASAFIAFYMVDSDGDQYANLVDEFPGCDDAGPDTDADGIPNECDVCPCDSNNDSDGDGFCTVVCPNTVVDLCPQVADVPFDNCNEIAENAHNATRLGDRCDPAICPSTFVAAATSGPEQKLPCPQAGSDPDQQCPPTSEGYTTWLNCNTYVRDSFEITPLASFGPTGASTSGGAVGTSARFCQQNDALGVACNDPAEDFQDEQLDDFGQAPNAASETKFSHFHRITFASGGPSSPDASGSLTYSLTPTSVPSATWKWAFAADQSRWLSNNQIDLVPGDTPLLGTIWLHADVPKGGTIDIGRGTHGWDMNNWFETGEGTFAGAFSPEAFYCTSCGFLKIPGVFNGGGSGGSSSSLTVEAVSGTASKTPWLVWRTGTSSRSIRAFRRPEASAREASILWPVDSGMGTVGTNCGTGTAARAGTGQLVAARLGANLRARLSNSSLRWFNSVEPSLQLGAGTSFPIAVALSPNAGFVDTVVSNGAQLTSDADRRVTRAAVRLGTPNAPADGYTAVLTRARRGVFVIANRSATGLPGGIWFTPIDANRWRRFNPSGYQPEKVLAATYSFATDSLYILDQTSGAARLVQMRVASGTVTTLGTWPRHSDWSRHALVVEKSGSLLLASTNPARRMHTVTRLHVRNPVGYRDGGGYNRAYELFAPPVVDPDGYTSLVWTGTKYTRIRERSLAMTRTPGATGATDLVELGQQL